MVARVPSGGCDGDSDGADGAGFELGPLLHRTRGRSSPGHSHDRQKGKSSATVFAVAVSICSGLCFTDYFFVCEATNTRFF